MSNKDQKYKSGYEFEREVAAIYRTFSAKVEHDIAIAGNQIDILVTEQTPSGAPVRIGIECKAYSKPVGLGVINGFGAISYLLKQRNLVDKTVMVSTSGFTDQAREAAKEHNIELIELADLQQRVRGHEEAFHKAEQEIDVEHKKTVESPNRPKRAFVLMPFSKEFEDVYILGIREVAERLGMVVERADDIEHNEGILDMIFQKIRECDVAIADTTNHNPNVFYEIGFCHASGKPTILIARTGQNVLFDLRMQNHIFYDTIVDLREKLERRLRATLDL